jgi:hypothetical protein
LIRNYSDLNNPRRAEELMKVTAHPQGVNKKLKADENEIFDGTPLSRRTFQLD